jgi:hypothetical protein
MKEALITKIKKQQNKTQMQISMLHLKLKQLKEKREKRN